MSTELRVKLLQACDAYLSDTEDHPNGFCYWATYTAPLFPPDNGAVYDLIDGLRKEMAGLCEHDSLPLYVDDNSGRTPERIQFVQDLRGYLLLDI